MTELDLARGGVGQGGMLSKYCEEAAEGMPYCLTLQSSQLRAILSTQTARVSKPLYVLVQNTRIRR